MIAKVISTLLSRGFTASKKYTVEQLCDYLPLLHHIIEKSSYTGYAKCNSNKFWDYDNRDNRRDLAFDVLCLNVSKPQRYEVMQHITDRMEFGDAYGIDKSEVK